MRWKAYEHQHEEKSADWYWALSIIAISAALTSVLFNNVLFAAVIVAAAIVLGMLARQNPEIVEFIITERGVATGDSFHEYDRINAFWIDEDNDVGPTLLIDTDKLFAPHLVIPLSGEAPPKEVRKLLQKFVKEKPLSEPISHKILEMLGF